VTGPVPTLEAVLPGDRRFVAVRRRKGWVLAAVAAVAFLLLVTGTTARLGVVGIVLVLVVLVPVLIWSNVLDLRLGSNRRALWNDPPTFLVRADDTVGFSFAGSRQHELRGTGELVHVALGSVTGTGVGDGFAVRAPYTGVLGALSGDLGKVPGAFWAQAADGPALWLCFPDRDWLVCTPRAAELAQLLGTLGPVPWGSRPPVAAPTALREGRWSSASAPGPVAPAHGPAATAGRTPVVAPGPVGSTEWSGVVVPLPGGEDLLVGTDGRVALGRSPSAPSTPWRGAGEIVLVELGEVSGSAPSDGWAGPQGWVGVRDGQGLWLCFPDRDWLVCSERVLEVVALLVGSGPLPWATADGPRPAPAPTALRTGRWTSSEVRVDRTP
jgi:hypothetical protein